LYIDGAPERRIIHTTRRIIVRMPVTREVIVAMRKAMARFASPLFVLELCPSGLRRGVVSAAGPLFMMIAVLS
jgi:hypothetical protein